MGGLSTILNTLLLLFMVCGNKSQPFLSFIHQALTEKQMTCYTKYRLSSILLIDGVAARLRVRFWKGYELMLLSDIASITGQKITDIQYFLWAGSGIE